jgi:paraquat-inducible protein B
MSKQVNKIAIGGFVIGAIGLGILASLVFGSGKFFQKKSVQVMYFEGSVKGLNIGAPVKFRGVDIGMVQDVALTIDPHDNEFYVPVYVEIFQDRLTLLDSQKDMFEYYQNMKEMDKLVNEMGLRAQLQLQSMVTGQLFVNYDFYPDTEVKRVGLEKEYYEIPTIPTTLQMLSGTIEQIVQDFRKANFQEIIKNISETAEGINDLVNSDDLQQSIRDLRAAAKDLKKLIMDADTLVVNVNDRVDPVSDSLELTMADTRHLVKNIDSRLEPVAGSVEETLDSIQTAFTEAGNLLTEAEDLIAKDSYMSHEIVKTLESLSAASRAIQDLADYLQRQPEAFIKGKR